MRIAGKQPSISFRHVKLENQNFPEVRKTSNQVIDQINTSPSAATGRQSSHDYQTHTRLSSAPVCFMNTIYQKCFCKFAANDLGVIINMETLHTNVLEILNLSPELRY